MAVILKDLHKYDVEWATQIRNVKMLNNLYQYYKNGYESLKKLYEGGLSTEESWDIINTSFMVDLFFDEEETYAECEILGLNPKRLKTEFVMYTKEDNDSEPEFFFEDWLVLESGKFDSDKVYSEYGIDELLKNGDIKLLCSGCRRPVDSNLIRKNNNLYLCKNHSFGGSTIEFIDNESGLEPTNGQGVYLTHFPDLVDIEFNLYWHPDIKKRVADRMITKEVISEGIDFFRFKALEILKIMKNILHNVNGYEQTAEEERQLLLK